MPGVCLPGWTWCLPSGSLFPADLSEQFNNPFFFSGNMRFLHIFHLSDIIDKSLGRIFLPFWKVHCLAKVYLENTPWVVFFINIGSVNPHTSDIYRPFSTTAQFWLLWLYIYTLIYSIEQSSFSNLP